MVALLKMPRYEEFCGEADSDRRMFPRKKTDAQAVAHRLDHTIFARQNPRLTLNLRDISAGGLSALSDQRLQEGELVSVCVPRRGLMSGWDACGRVIRCSPSPSGYEVGVEFDMRAAA
jgi:PilZ domain-containing protein